MKIKTTNGYINYSIEEDEIIIDHVEVINKRQGTGRKLIKQVLQIAREHGLHVTLCAYPQNESISQENLREFYESLGFELHPDDVDYTYYISQ
ncbi:MAG: N-acetyltransferase [Novosphingobium sp.]|nr:N-acetyltransferase [Novosphingobium sp.]